jgi:hypothetical protein
MVRETRRLLLVVLLLGKERLVSLGFSLPDFALVHDPTGDEAKEETQDEEDLFSVHGCRLLICYL